MSRQEVSEQNENCGGRNIMITSQLLEIFLYGKRKIQGIDLENAKRQKTGDGKYPKQVKWSSSSHQSHDIPSQTIEAGKSVRRILGPAIYDIKLTYAVLSFPAEVQLCTSSIPGHQYGVCAKLPFPVGTWIGPYEGQRVKPSEMSDNNQSRYMWEIYEDGNFSHYLDGSDEKCSSWMRFIRCARHKDEQNMVVFQYGTNIYYRAVRDIPSGCELLVWYNNNYTQFLGVPLGLRNVPGGKNGQEKITAQSGNPVPQAEVKPVLKEKNTDDNDTDLKTFHKQYSPQKTPTTNVTYCNSECKPTLPPMYGLSSDKSNQIRHQVSHYSDMNGKGFSFSSRLSSSSYTSVSPSFEALPHEGNSVGYTSRLVGRPNNLSPSDSIVKGSLATSEKPYQCGHCSSSFALPSELSSHVVTHVNDKPFKCGICSRSFGGANTLYNHMRTHTGNRAFLCSKCGRTFETATQLSRHVRTPGECPMVGSTPQEVM